MSESSEPARILVVDDEPTNRTLLKAALVRQEYQVELANDGYEAIEKLGAGSFDLVLLDLDMPGWTGLDVLERMKANPDLRRIPVIIVSATQELDGVVQCIEAGATDYLPKPFDRVLLEARVKSSLAAKRVADALEARNQEEVTSPSLPAPPLPSYRAEESSITSEHIGSHLANAYGQVADDDDTMQGLPASTPGVTERSHRSSAASIPPVSQGSHHAGRWDRFTLLPGVELHVRDSNAIPSAPEQRKVWLATVLDRLRSQLEVRDP
jgi:CheY-like chemotaxis protein